MASTAPAPFFLAQPASGTAGHPAIVVIMEGNGMSQQLLRVCQRLAHEGYTAIAPDLFHHFGGSDDARARMGKTRQAASQAHQDQPGLLMALQKALTRSQGDARPVVAAHAVDSDRDHESSTVVNRMGTRPWSIRP